MNKKVKIFFANHAQFEAQYTNLGDWAIFEQMIGKLGKFIEEGRVEVYVPTSDVNYTKEHYPVIPFKRGGITGIFYTLAIIIRSDIVIIGGGEIVQDKSSIVYIPYQLIRPFIAKLFGKKLFGYAIGVGKKDEISKFGQLISRFVLNMFDIITVRDEKSLDILKSFLNVNKPQIYLTADPALNLQTNKVNFDFKRDVITVSIRSVYHRNHNFLPFSIRKKLKLVSKQYYEEIEIFKNTIAQIVTKVVNKHKYEILFLNTYTGKQMSAEDDIFTKDVINRLPEDVLGFIHVIPSNYTPSQIKYCLGHSKLIISVPLHPIILGASEEVPSISLSYASKTESFMNEIHMDNYVHSVKNLGDKLDENKLLDDINKILENYSFYKMHISEKIYELKKREEMNLQLLLELAEVEKGTTC